MANKVKFGLKNVHYAKITETDGQITYGTPKRIPGAVSLTVDAQGDEDVFYADDTAYYRSYSNNGYSGTLEVAIIPDDFRIDILGETLTETSNVLVERANVETAKFALLYQFSGDANNTLRVLYYCSASRPSEGGSTTNNTRTPQTETLSFAADALPNGNIKAKTTDTTPDSVKAGWFTAVWQPSEDEPAQTEE